MALRAVLSCLDGEKLQLKRRFADIPVNNDLLITCHFTFHSGQYKFAKSHEWVKLEGTTATIGISEYAQVGLYTQL